MDMPQPLDPRMVDNLAFRDLASSQFRTRNKGDIAVNGVVTEVLAVVGMHDANYVV